MPVVLVCMQDVLLSVEFEQQIVAPIIQAAELSAHHRANLDRKSNTKSSSRRAERKLYDKYLAAFRRDPLGAAGKALLGAHDPMNDLPLDAASLAYNASSVPLRGVLKARTLSGDIHFRPLCTTGDLLLALYELGDGSLFEDGFVQLQDIPLFEKKGAFMVPLKEPFSSVTRGTPKLVYRLVHRAHRPDMWMMARFV